jgi:hypothetical protein
VLATPLLKSPNLYFLRDVWLDSNPESWVLNFVMCKIPLPEIIDTVFAKTSQNARVLLSENERFGLVFVNTGSINSGTYLESIFASRMLHGANIAWHRTKLIFVIVTKILLKKD